MRSCPRSDPPTSSLPPPSRLGQDGPQTGPGSGSAQHPLPARKATPETVFGHRSSHWPWAGALRRDGETEGQRDRETERRRDGDRSYLPNQSPSQTMPRPGPQSHCHHPRTRSAHKTPGGTAPAPCSPLPSLAVPTVHVALLRKLQQGHPRCQKKARRSRLGEPSPRPQPGCSRRFPWALPARPPSPGRSPGLPCRGLQTAARSAAGTWWPLGPEKAVGAAAS